MAVDEGVSDVTKDADVAVVDVNQAVGYGLGRAAGVKGVEAISTLCTGTVEDVVDDTVVNRREETGRLVGVDDQREVAYLAEVGIGDVEETTRDGVRDTSVGG